MKPDISLGDILQLLAMVGVVLTAYFTLSARVSVLEANLITDRKGTEDFRQEMRDATKEITHRLDNLKR